MSNEMQINSRAIEIANCLEKGMNTHELLKRFSAKWNCTERTVERMIALAKDLVLGRIRDAATVLDILRTESISEDLATQLLSNIELQASLCNIATGKVTAEQVYNTKEGLKTIEVKPGINMQMKAIGMLLKARKEMRDHQKQSQDQSKPIPPFIINVLNEEEKRIVEAI